MYPQPPLPMKSTPTEPLLDLALRRDGASLALLRRQRRRWFLVAAFLVGLFPVVALLLRDTRFADVTAFFALPLIVVAFVAGQRAGQVESVDRLRATQVGTPVIPLGSS